MFVLSLIKKTKIMETLTPLLEQLALKLGTTTEYLWGVLITQAKVQIWIYSFRFVLFFILMFVFYKVVRYFSKNWDDLEEDFLGGMIFSYIVMGLSTVIFIAVIIGNIGDLITVIYNPEYWALDKVLSIINK